MEEAKQRIEQSKDIIRKQDRMNKIKKKK